MDIMEMRKRAALDFAMVSTLLAWHPRRMDLDDLITEKCAPPNRAGRHDGEFERHLSEGAVMLAYAMHLARLGAKGPVGVHPDGMHAQAFPLRTWLEDRGFVRTEGWGKTEYGGLYVREGGPEILLRPKSGIGDVIATVDGVAVLAECKGGAINTRHPGQQSKLAKGLHEAVGLLMSVPKGGVQVRQKHADRFAGVALRLGDNRVDVGVCRVCGCLFLLPLCRHCTALKMRT